MLGSDLYIALIIGTVLSLIYTEKTGILPAGLIVPGYLALVFDQPIFLTVIFLISLCTYLIVSQVIGRFTILYGRRKFAAMMTIGIALKLVFDYFYPLVPFESLELAGIGVIVPGLIANGISRQGVIPTIGSTLLLSGITFLIMLVYYLI